MKLTTTHCFFHHYTSISVQAAPPSDSGSGFTIYSFAYKTDYPASRQAPRTAAKHYVMVDHFNAAQRWVLFFHTLTFCSTLNFPPPPLRVWSHFMRSLQFFLTFVESFPAGGGRGVG